MQGSIILIAMCSCVKFSSWHSNYCFRGVSYSHSGFPSTVNAGAPCQVDHIAAPPAALFSLSPWWLGLTVWISSKSAELALSERSHAYRRFLRLGRGCLVWRYATLVDYLLRASERGSRYRWFVSSRLRLRCASSLSEWRQPRRRARQRLYTSQV